MCPVQQVYQRPLVEVWLCCEVQWAEWHLYGLVLKVHQQTLVDGRGLTVLQWVQKCPLDETVLQGCHLLMVALLLLLLLRLL